MLYQTSYPLHGFSDSPQGKAKGSKSKKGKLDKSSSEDLDPKSLLGALMSQDESVYVCQPDTEPKMSYHSSLFSQQKGDNENGSLLSDDNLHIISNGEMGKCNSKTLSYDPLLATLDSLTLDGEETCSNSELFSALENLGLNAEDLELLLLDERMIQVELDPNHIPTLNDLLTNNEILSYIHDALENGTEGEREGGTGGFGVNSNSAQSSGQQLQASLTPAVPPAHPSSRQPIIQLSQQMQLRMSAGELVKAQPGTVDTRSFTGIPNGHWVATTENQHPPNIQTHYEPHTFLKSSQLNGELQQLNSLLESSQQWQLEQDQDSAQSSSHQQVISHSALLPGFQNPLGLTTNGSYIPKGHATFPTNVEVNHTGYSITPAPHAGSTVLNGMTAPDVCHYQSYQLQAHQKHQQQMLQQTQVPPPCLPQNPTQSSALELQQLLGLSQPQHSLPSIEAYSMFQTSTHDSTHSKVRVID